MTFQTKRVLERMKIYGYSDFTESPIFMHKVDARWSNNLHICANASIISNNMGYAIYCLHNNYKKINKFNK